MPHTMQIWDIGDTASIPAVDDIFRVTEVKGRVLDMHGGLGTHIELEPCAGDEQLRAELTQTQRRNLAALQDIIDLRTNLADACAARDALAREYNQLEADREWNASLVMRKDRELTRAITLMASHIKGLQIEHDQLVDRIEDAMGQIEKYDKHIAENHIQYAVEDVLARLVQLEGEPMIEVEITGKEMVEALQTERQLRQEAKRTCEAMSEMARNRGTRLEEARQRAETFYQELSGAHEALDECQVRRNYDDCAQVSIRTRIFWLNERAEALAQLVTVKLAELLERLAKWTIEAVVAGYAKDYSDHKDDVTVARALAASIREVLARERQGDE